MRQRFWPLGTKSNKSYNGPVSATKVYTSHPIVVQVLEVALAIQHSVPNAWCAESAIVFAYGGGNEEAQMTERTGEICNAGTESA